MPRIEAVFFWLGGVITETIPEAIARLMYGMPLAKVSIDDRLRMRELMEQLGTRRVSAPDFCQHIVERSKEPYQAETLEAQIIATIPRRDAVLDVIGALPANYERWLLCDYPPEWTQAVANRLGLSGLFPEDRMLHTASSGLRQLVPDVFYYLAHQAGKPASECLVIDADSARAVQAVRHGLQSTVYVDVRRLRRDFVLRRMLPKPPDYVMPGPRGLN